MGAADADQEHAVWFELDEGGPEYIRADLAAPSAPAEVDGLRGIIGASNNVIDGLTAKNSALQFETARLTSELAQPREAVSTWLHFAELRA